MYIPAEDELSLSIRAAANKDANSLQLGNGICTMAGLTRAIAVEGSEFEAEHGVDYDAAIVQCTSLEDVKTHLAISASVSFKSLGMRGSASFNFLHNTSFSRYDCNLLAQFNYAGKKMAFDGNPELKKGAFDGSVSDFYRQYGDEYVHTIEYGGTLLLVFTYHATTFEEIKSFRSFASAKVGKVKASMSIDKGFERFTKDDKLTLAITSIGLDATQLPVGERLVFDEKLMKEVVDFIRDAPLRVDELSTNVIGIETRQYVNIDKKFFAIENVITGSKWKVADLAELRDTGSLLDGDLNFAIDNPQLFDASEEKVEELRQARKGPLKDVLKRIDRQAEAIWLDPWHTGELKDLGGEIRTLEALRPREIEVLEPIVVAEFVTHGRHPERVVLSAESGNTWIGYRGQPINRLRVWCEPKIAGAELVLQVQANALGGSTTQEGEWVPERPSPIFNIGFWMTGASADLYDVHYSLLTHTDIANGTFIGKPGETHGFGNGTHGVEQVHVAVGRK